VQASTIHPIILLYKLLFIGDCTGGEINGRGSVSSPVLYSESDLNWRLRLISTIFRRFDSVQNKNKT
jgi:hypothetical protein